MRIKRSQAVSPALFVSAAHCVTSIFRQFRCAQTVEHAEILDWVGVAGEHHCEGAHPRAWVGFLGRSGGSGCVSSSHSMIASDLRDDTAVIRLERRHEPLRIEVEIIGRALLAFAEVMIDWCSACQPLKIEARCGRDSSPRCGSSRAVSLRGGRFV